MPRADIRVTKAGPNGRPVAEVSLDAGVALDDLAGLVQKHVTRNRDLLRKVGLRACAGCISGFDIWIRHRYDHIIDAEFGG